MLDHAFSTVKGVGAKDISRILAELDHPQVTAFEQVLKKHDLKSLFLKAGELSGKAKGQAIASQVEAYLQSGKPYPVYNYTIRRPSRTNGFTSPSWDHVVVKARTSDKLAAVSSSELSDAVGRAILDAVAGTGPMDGRWWSFSKAAETLVNSPARVVCTWAHEMGHQVYYKAGRPEIPPQLSPRKAGGRPSLTRYGGTNDSEWFAEHFAAWLLAPGELNQALPDAFAFITDMVERAG
jgi:hypothetical protein